MYKTGNSLRCWRDYFPNAIVHGIDIYDCDLNENRIKTYNIDQTDIKNLDIFNSLDLIIDNGSQILEHQVISFMALEKKLTINGLYIIENISDISCFKDLKCFPKENNIKNDYNIYYVEENVDTMQWQSNPKFCGLIPKASSKGIYYNSIGNMCIFERKEKKIFVKGGQQYELGNCIFQIAAAAYYCEKYNYTLFLDGNSESLNYRTSNNFNRQTQKKSYFNQIFKNINKEYNNFAYNTIAFNNYTDNIILPDDSLKTSMLSDVSTQNNILIDGYCQNINLFYDIKDKLLNYLYFNDNDNINYIKTTYNLHDYDVNVMVGLRIDSDGGFNYSNLTIKSYKYVMNKIISENKNKKVGFFIVSDIAPALDLFSPDFILENNIDIIYVNEDDIMQMYLGLECKYHILGDNTFHYWIGVLSKTPQNVYIFNNTDITTRKLQLPNWNIVQQQPDDFIFLKLLDQPGYDLYHKDCSVPILKELALKDPNCVAFNTMGWFKNNISYLSSSTNFGPNEGIYIKTSYWRKT